MLPMPRIALALSPCALVAVALAVAGCSAPEARGRPQQPPTQARGMSPAPPPAGEDPRASEVPGLLGSALGALQQSGDGDAAAQAIVPYVHRSLLDASGKSLTADVRSFSFKKAHAAAGVYANPVKITRVRPNEVTAIGYGPTAEQGRAVDYFIAKKDGQAGMPAPVTVFFPASGGPPRVSYLGSL